MEVSEFMMIFHRKKRAGMGSSRSAISEGIPHNVRAMRAGQNAVLGCINECGSNNFDAGGTRANGG
jgi:hypothetical protein